MRSWVDDDGMSNLKGWFDPVTGKDLARRLDAATDAMFAEQTPDTAPSDPIEPQQHLRGPALAGIISGDAGPLRRGGDPIVVVDATQSLTSSEGATGPALDWGIPVEVPTGVLLDVLGSTSPDVVVVANGVVLHAPGRLDLGRTTRLANRAQRRALRGLYSNCAVPGCGVHYDRCKLHHIEWWRHGGATDLNNLLPVCAHHHNLIHNDGWTIALGPNRQLTIGLRDGQLLRTGPPKRNAASRGRSEPKGIHMPPPLLCAPEQLMAQVAGIPRWAVGLHQRQASRTFRRRDHQDSRRPRQPRARRPAQHQGPHRNDLVGALPPPRRRASPNRPRVIEV